MLMGEMTPVELQARGVQGVAGDSWDQGLVGFGEPLFYKPQEGVSMS